MDCHQTRIIAFFFVCGVIAIQTAAFLLTSTPFLSEGVRKERKDILDIYRAETNPDLKKELLQLLKANNARFWMIFLIASTITGGFALVKAWCDDLVPLVREINAALIKAINLSCNPPHS